MEFYEKLQQLRKSRKLTQEELAEVLFVSRTAISKWESGRGYPNLESLKQISLYFCVSIDDLLSSDKIIQLAQQESQQRLYNLCGFLYAVVDLFALMLIILPLYPETVGGYVYSVNLWTYSQIAFYNKAIYWVLFIVLFLCGFSGLIETYLKDKRTDLSIKISLFLSIVTVLYLSISTEAYATTLATLMMIAKFLLALKMNHKI